MDLRTLADRLQIDDLLTSYTRAIDTGDWDRLDAVFTPDAEIDYTSTGGIAGRYPEVKAWLAENLPLFPRRQHVLGQKEVALDGEPGLYHHDLVRTADGWRSARLVEELCWKRGL